LYSNARRLRGALAAAVRDASKDAELGVLRHENAVSHCQIARVRRTWADLIRLTALLSLIPRRGWAEVFAVTPATPPSRHRRPVKHKRDYTARRSPGRPATTTAVRKPVTAMANDNPGRGHRRIHGEPHRPGHCVPPSTLRQILHDAGSDPAPWRVGPTRGPFPRAQARHIAAADSVHMDTALLKRLHASLLIEHGSRRAHPPVPFQAHSAVEVSGEGG
jgi:putative transposase